MSLGSHLVRPTVPLTTPPNAHATGPFESFNRNELCLVGHMHPTNAKDTAGNSYTHWHTLLLRRERASYLSHTAHPP